MKSTCTWVPSSTWEAKEMRALCRAAIRHREAAFPKGKLHLGGAGLQGVFHQVIDQALQQRPVPLYFPIGGEIAYPGKSLGRPCEQRRHRHLLHPHAALPQVAQ